MNAWMPGSSRLSFSLWQRAQRCLMNEARSTSAKGSRLDNTPEVVAADDNLCGEGPIWDTGCKCLWWTDLSSKLLYQLAPSTGAKKVVGLNWMVSGIAID